MAQTFYFGPYSDGIRGFKTALPGYDVMVEADDNNAERRSFNSRDTSGYAKIAMVVRGTSSSIFHGLGYIPHFEVKIVAPGTPYTFYNDVYNGYQNSMWPWVTETDLSFAAMTGFVGGAGYSGPSLALFWDDPR